MIHKRLLATVAVTLLLGACTGEATTTTTAGDGLVPTTSTSTTSTTASPTTSPSTLPDLEGQVVTVLVDHQSFPFNFLGEGDEPTGWDYAAMQAICQALNCEVEFAPTDGELLAALVEGEGDLVANGTAIAEQDGVVFSNPYLQFEQNLIVRREDDRFNTVGELSGTGAVVGAVAGTNNEAAAIDNWGQARVQSHSDLDSAVGALLAEEVDAVIIHSYGGQGYVGEGDTEVKIIQGVLGSGELGLAFPSDSDLLEPFNLALDALNQGGTLGTLNAVWFAPATAS